MVLNGLPQEMNERVGYLGARRKRRTPINHTLSSSILKVKKLDSALFATMGRGKLFKEKSMICWTALKPSIFLCPWLY
jgi:hypothetical protein